MPARLHTGQHIDSMTPANLEWRVEWFALWRCLDGNPAYPVGKRVDEPEL